MPLYAYHCLPCVLAVLEMRTMDERHDAPVCFNCKQPMKLIITPVAGIVKNPAVPRRTK